MFNRTINKLAFLTIRYLEADRRIWQGIFLNVIVIWIKVSCLQGYEIILKDKKVSEYFVTGCRMTTAKANTQNKQ